jgi:hypothetical protein
MAPIGRILAMIGARIAGGGVAPDVPAMRDTSELQPSVRGSLIVVGPDAGAHGVDSAAGCEFLDDRLRSE